MSTILPFVEDTTPSAEIVAPPKSAGTVQSKKRKKNVDNDNNDNKPNSISTLSDTTDAATETSKSLHFETKPGTAITSFTYEQVNDDADELIELRGEGRYFGVTDPESGDTINAQQSLGPLCTNCHKRGHIRAKCKTVVCHQCGKIGDHYEAQCPSTSICGRCGQKGHLAAGCTSKKKKREYCKNCDTFNHGGDRCPSIWRSYLTKKDEDKEDALLVLPVLYCYNCGSKNHYGDDCVEARSSRVPNLGSAFSGSNLPRKLRSLYFSQRSNGSNSRPSLAVQYEEPSYLEKFAASPLFRRDLEDSRKRRDYSSGRNGSNRNYNSNNNFNGYSNNSSYNNNSSYKNNNKTNNYNNNSYGGLAIDFPRGNNNVNNRNYNNNNNNNNNNTRINNSRNFQQKPTRSAVLPPKKGANFGKHTIMPTNSGKVAKPSRSGLIQSQSARAKQSGKRGALHY